MGDPKSPRPVRPSLEGGVHGRAQGGSPVIISDTPPSTCSVQKDWLWGGGPGPGEVPNVAPDLGMHAAQDG